MLVHVHLFCLYMILMYSSKSLKFVVTISCPFRFKFDDERVTKEDVKRALEEQYGGEEEVFLFFPLYKYF